MSVSEEDDDSFIEAEEENPNIFVDKSERSAYSSLPKKLRLLFFKITKTKKYLSVVLKPL